METDQLDRIDRNILAALSADGRMSMAALAAKVGLSKTPVQARLRKLEESGFIRGYQAIVDREKMGEGHVAFVQVKLSDTRSDALDAFNQAVPTSRPAAPRPASVSGWSSPANASGLNSPP